MVDIRLFDAWNIVKKKLEQKSKTNYIKEGQVWWCSVGQNLGSEVYGKGVNFVRPVLVFIKLSEKLFLGIPLTTKQKSGDWFVPFVFNNRSVTALLYHIRIFDRKRLIRRLGEIISTDYESIEIGFKMLYCTKKVRPAVKQGSGGNIPKIMVSL